MIAVWLTVVAYAWLRHADLWRETVLRRPVVALESDDWGPGPTEDADGLRELAACAEAHRDEAHRPAAVTLGVVLAVADTSVQVGDRECYRRLTLGSERFSGIRGAMLDGMQKGVFFLQLHGAEHCWPPALVVAANSDDSVRLWLSTQGVPRTESLPPFLQSRWTDSSTLPSKPLPDAAISAAVDDEVNVFASVFGVNPNVVVPPTFVWDERVERAWARRGIRVVITPGCRFEARDASGNLQSPTKLIRNGDRTASSQIVYLVRDVYFEPSLGHQAENVLGQIMHRFRLGRPAFVEMHRFNFIDDVKRLRSSLAELNRLLELALHALPDLRFVAPAELAESIVRQDPHLIETRLMGRLAVWLRRLWEERRIRWLAIVTAAVVPVGLLWLAASLATGKLSTGVKA